MYEIGPTDRSAPWIAVHRDLARDMTVLVLDSDECYLRVELPDNDLRDNINADSEAMDRMWATWRDLAGAAP